MLLQIPPRMTPQAGFRRIPKANFSVYLTLIIASRLEWRMKFQFFSVDRLWSKISLTKKASKLPVFIIFPHCYVIFHKLENNFRFPHILTLL